MAKRLSDQQREEIIENFINGNTIEELSNNFSCTKLTISRNLKKSLGEKVYYELIKKNKFLKESLKGIEKKITNNLQIKSNDNKALRKGVQPESDSDNSVFFEIAPLDLDIDNQPQKDLSSIPITDISFPKIVYLIVDNKIELVPKFLKDYPGWQFLPKDDLSRKTLKIYFDLKNAKRDCNNDQKVIKIPNSEIFKIVAPILISRGISRLVSADKLIAL